MRMLILVICWLAAAQGAAAAQAATVTGITITNLGTYIAQTTSAPAKAGQQSPTRTVGTDRDWQLLSASPDVLGKVGTQFGIEFRLDGTPADEAVTIYVVLTFPPQGIRNPNTGDRFYKCEIAFPNMKIGALCLLGYASTMTGKSCPASGSSRNCNQDDLAERSLPSARRSDAGTSGG